MSPLLLALVLAQATIYSWTDKSGLEHFTDDLTSIPRGVKVRTTEGAEISRVESDAAKNPRPAVAPAPTQPATPSTSEQTWRQLFRTARNHVTDLEEEIESDRKKVEEVNGLPVRAGFSCGNFGPQFHNSPIVTTGTVVVTGGQPLPSISVGGSVTSFPTVVGSPCFFSFNPEWERIRERLEKNRRELPRAKEELADLDRRASFEAVPQHWRR